MYMHRYTHATIHVRYTFANVCVTGVSAVHVCVWCNAWASCLGQIYLHMYECCNLKPTTSNNSLRNVWLIVVDRQALAPLCVDRESVERVERVRHQLEMISRCTLRVSCTAELLGATHQERRVSRAALLADRYLQVMRARCDKISADLAETKWEALCS